MTVKQGVVPSLQQDVSDLYKRVRALEAYPDAGGDDCCVAVERFEAPADTGLGANVTDTDDGSSDYLALTISGFDDYSDTGYASSADFQTIGMPYLSGTVYFVQVAVFVPSDPTSGLQADDMRKQWALDVSEGEAADIDSFPDLAGVGVDSALGFDSTFGRAAASYDLAIPTMTYQFFWRYVGADFQGLQFILEQTHPGGDPGLRQVFGISSSVWIARLHKG